MGIEFNTLFYFCSACCLVFTLRTGDDRKNTENTCRLRAGETLQRFRPLLHQREGGAGGKSEMEGEKES